MFMTTIKWFLLILLVVAFPPILLLLVPYWLLNGRRSKKRKYWAHSGNAVQRIKKKQKGRCKYCGRKVGNSFHVDHVVPLSRGGKDKPGNLAVACPRCNLSKGNKLVHEWK